MSAARFHVDADLAAGTEVPLPPEVTHHAVRVLRLRSGAAITVFNGQGGEWQAQLLVEGARAWVIPEQFDPVERESPLQVILVQAWVGGDKLEWVVEKAVELGVAELVLVPAARSVIQLDAPRQQRRLQRLNETVVAACCQCGRNRIPALHSSDTLAAGLASALQRAGRGLLLDPQAGEPLTAPAPGGAVALAVGPEGGFDAAERSLAERLGFRPTRVGPRILRTETAGLVGLAALQVLAGDLR